MKIGIAITLYDKFDELKILVDIIRSNWKGKYYIAVSSNHPDAQKRMEGIPVDVFIQARDIYWTPGLAYIRSMVNMTCRIQDSLQHSCKLAMTLPVDYVLHLHTDAWPLKESEVLDLVSFMKEHKIMFAARGMGLAKARPDCPLGHIDDMFFIFDTSYVKKVGFFDYDPLDMLPDRLTVHGVLSLLIVSKIGLKNFYLYENHTKQIFWDGQRADPYFERGKPMMFDLQRGFLHVHSQSFPGDLGKNLQAYYLQGYGITKGPAIEPFLQKYLLPKGVLFKRLNKLEKELDLQLRWNGYFLPLERFGRDFHKKKEYLEMPFSKKLRFLAVNTSRLLWTELFGKKRLKAGKYYGLELYPEISVWPRDLGDFYAEHLDEKDYFSKETVWFVKNKKV
ncbi:hypothetical protein J4424_02220 [Candidatus Woesearchaeota archaeon]|nr:hypothetical protein [Candidatus Woesearchaeota archaeon]